MKIAIRFGDNDFHSTFFGVLKTINEGLKYNSGCYDELKIEANEQIRETLTIIINELSLGCYLSWQHGNRIITDDKRKYYKEYLTITKNLVYINEEVDSFMSEHSDHNGAFFVLDSNLDHKNNEPIYSF